MHRLVHFEVGEVARALSVLIDERLLPTHVDSFELHGVALVSEHRPGLPSLRDILLEGLVHEHRLEHGVGDGLVGLFDGDRGRRHLRLMQILVHESEALHHLVNRARHNARRRLPSLNVFASLLGVLTR